MSYLLAETGGLLLASMILGCALGYLIGSMRSSNVAGDVTSSPEARRPMSDDDRVVYEDNLRRARAEIVRLEKQNTRMTSALEAARAVPTSVPVSAGGDRWDASPSAETDARLGDLEADLAGRESELAARESEFAELHHRNEQVEDALAVRENEIEELEESIRVMHRRVAEAEATPAGSDASGLHVYRMSSDDEHVVELEADHDTSSSDQLRTELEQARARLIRLDERQLELDQLVTRLRGPAARAERLELETGRLRDRLRLREARLRELEQGQVMANATSTDASGSRSGGSIRGARRVRASGSEKVGTARRSTGVDPEVAAADLTRIDGIGPVLARMLQQRGVSSLSDLAELSDTDITDLESQLPEFATRIRRDRWVEQAHHLLSKRNTR